MQAQLESRKVESLRELLSLVVTNTKREMQGKTSNSSREDKAVENHLAILLGRKPEAAELKTALRYS
jgi:hypothetical protein